MASPIMDWGQEFFDKLDRGHLKATVRHEQMCRERERSLLHLLEQAVLEGDGRSTDDIPVRVAVEIAGDGVAMDFAGTAPQVPGNVNCPIACGNFESVTNVAYVFPFGPRDSLNHNPGQSSHMGGNAQT